MRLNPTHHLAYCTNVHRGSSWAEMFGSLQRYTLAVRNEICPEKPYAIGLRLSDQASRELSDPATLLFFQKWLQQHNCYVFTINGFPFGRFHGSGVKEQVYLPDWTSPDRLSYTNRLLDLLAQLLPAGMEGSISTVPGGFKPAGLADKEQKLMRKHLFACIQHAAELKEKTGKLLHLGLEPEPLCTIENTTEAVEFFQKMHSEYPNDPSIHQHLGITYDACHFAVEFESPIEALERLCRNQTKISKIHLSSALALRPEPQAVSALNSFADQTYLHQVIVRSADGSLKRYKDINFALHDVQGHKDSSEEWRVHFHVPLHSPACGCFNNTSDHLLGVLDYLQDHPDLCSHLEMETYTWEVLPPELKSRSVVEQIAAEYRWCLSECQRRGLHCQSQLS